MLKKPAVSKTANLCVTVVRQSPHMMLWVPHCCNISMCIAGYQFDVSSGYYEASAHSNLHRHGFTRKVVFLGDALS